MLLTSSISSMLDQSTLSVGIPRKRHNAGARDDDGLTLIPATPTVSSVNGDDTLVNLRQRIPPLYVVDSMLLILSGLEFGIKL
jgi:hypothetical protein